MLEPLAGARPSDPNYAYSHSHSRTTSSNTFPMQGQPMAPMAMHLPSHSGPAVQQTRRSPSVNTFSTTSNIPPPAAYRTSSSTDLRRSISNRSTGTLVQPPTGYVALLRKQKATVWCDRAQYEDPRAVAQQRAAKRRANLEVVGSGRANPSGGRIGTGISTTGKVAAKIRHHGKTLVGYAPGENHVGVGGVPMRLSATEVEGESTDEDDAQPPNRLRHRRTGSSGRSSTGSGPRRFHSRYSGGPLTQAGQRWSSGDGSEPTTTGTALRQPAVVTTTAATSMTTKSNDDSARSLARSSRSGSSGECADNVGELSDVLSPRLASNSLKHAALTREKSVKSAEELNRRGSVDERTATLTSGRLFIANPD